MSQLQTINIRNSIPAKLQDIEMEKFYPSISKSESKSECTKVCIEGIQNKIVVTEGEFYENSSNATTPYLVKSAEMATAKIYMV